MGQGYVRRYRRAIRDVWACRQDARGVAFHLQNSLPRTDDRSGVQHMDTSGIWPSRDIVTTHRRGEHITKRGSLQRAAAVAGALEFTFRDFTEHGTSGTTRSFTVYIIENTEPHVTQPTATPGALAGERDE